MIRWYKYSGVLDLRLVIIYTIIQIHKPKYILPKYTLFKFVVNKNVVHSSITTMWLSFSNRKLKKWYNYCFLSQKTITQTTPPKTLIIVSKICIHTHTQTQSQTPKFCFQEKLIYQSITFHTHSQTLTQTSKTISKTNEKHTNTLKTPSTNPIQAIPLMNI